MKKELNNVVWINPSKFVNFITSVMSRERRTRLDMRKMI